MQRALKQYFIKGIYYEFKSTISSAHCVIFFIFFSLHFLANSTNNPPDKNLTEKEKSSLKLIQELEKFGRRELKLKLHQHFYTQWQEIEQKNTYVYISRSDSIVLPHKSGAFQFFGTDTLAAKTVADSCKMAGLDVLIYQTSGNSAVRLTHRLLNYPEEAIVFIVLHEMAHVHSNQKKLKIPYSSEESFGDFLGNIVGEFFVRKYHPEFLADFIKQKEKHEALYRLFEYVEKHAQGVPDLKKRDIYDSAQNQLATIIHSANAFQHDRFLYTMNHAYILRNRFYYKWYFDFKCVYNTYKIGKELAFFYSHIPQKESDLKQLLTTFCNQ
jgi:hypothetical protein